MSWVDEVDETASMARRAADLQHTLNAAGSPLTARDAYVAGAAARLDETLVASDTDFDVPVVKEAIDV